MMIAGAFHMLEESPEEHKRRQASFVLACVVEVLTAGLLALVSASLPESAANHANRYVLLTYPTAAEQEAIPKAPVLPRAVPRLLTPYVLPATRVEPPKVSEPRIRANIPVPNAGERLPPNTPAVARAEPLPPPPPAVHTGVFGQTPKDTVTEKSPVNQVQTGGFGNPQGVAGQAQGGNRSNVPKLGTFDMAVGPGMGNGPAGTEGRPQVVADAGFGARRQVTAINEIYQSDTSRAVGAAGFGSGGVDAGANGGSGDGALSTVKTGGFGALDPAPTAASRPVAATPEIRPVEILSKPSPQYTAEARRLRVQGEVVLSVIFQADGTLKVVGVIRSLGHGLDQMAEQAASEIKFKPAERRGKPTNFPAMLHIEFRLA